MSRQARFALITLLVLGVTAGVAAVVMKEKKQPIIADQQTTTVDNQPATNDKSCKLFSLEDAKKVLGDTAKTQDDGGEEQEIPSGTSLCAYSTQSEKQMQSITLITREPSNYSDQQEIKTTVDSLEANGYVKVDGYDKGFWNDKAGRFIALKGETLVIVEYNFVAIPPPDPPQEATPAGLTEHKKVADIVLSKI